jgi:hypothetical protein
MLTTEPANSGAIQQQPGNLGYRGTGWWRTQSLSNPSPLGNSLLTGKRTGNFSIFRIWPGAEALLAQ